jgi:3-hydroxyisobutyrate dehydrogenase
MNIAVLGIGLLGRAVAERLKATGHTVVVYNRTRTKTEPLQALGIDIAASAAQAIGSADCTLLFLADAEAIRSAMLNAEARASLAGRTIIQMGTIGPQESREFHKAVTESGGDYLEAPVLGSIAEARAGSLLLMVGGTQSQLQRWNPVFRSLGRAPHFVGTIGQAASLKLALNQLIAAGIAAFSLSLGLIRRAGVPVDLFMSVLKESTLFAPAFEKKLPRLQHRDYANPNFSTRHLLKDVNLALGEAQGQGLTTKGLEGIRDLLEKTIAHGHGSADYSAVYEEIDPQP